MNDDIGKWSFIIGLILAVLSGFFAIPALALVLLILGLVVGFLNISKGEETLYLIAVIVLLVIGVGGIQALSVLGTNISTRADTVLANFIIFTGATGLVVAVKAIIKSGKVS